MLQPVNQGAPADAQRLRRLSAVEIVLAQGAEDRLALDVLRLAGVIRVRRGGRPRTSGESRGQMVLGESATRTPA